MSMGWSIIGGPETSPVFGAPMDAFTHALLALKQLPGAQRAAWRARLFDYYVFSEDASDRLLLAQ